jgi:hypothetical protein
MADALVADVSGVITDFLGLDRPYAVLNPAGIAADQFLTRFPTSAGGLLIGPDLDGLNTLLHAATGDRDPTAQARKYLRDRLLGPSGSDRLGAFRAAVDRLCAASPMEAGAGGSATQSR